jgi:hypothetical protein
VLTPVAGGWLLTASTAGGRATVLLRGSGGEPLVGGGYRATGHLAAAVTDAAGKPVVTFANVGSTVTRNRD